LEEARKVIEKNFHPKPLGTESVSLIKAFNRVLAQDITAPINVPPFDRSTVDGYAVRAQDTFGAEENSPVILKIRGHVNVGETPKITLNQGETVAIMTGAPLPKGSDAVIMLEHTSEKDGKLFIYHAVSKGENTMKKGSDIKKGETILKTGQTLLSREVGIAAALGITKVKVYKKPKVAVLSTGSEIIEPGNPLPPGKIYDINSYALGAAILECDASLIHFGIVSDIEEELTTRISEALKRADVIVTSGGVSVGPRDVLPRVLDKLGKPGVIVYGIATKPGKPTTVALIEGKPVFSLPGHPTSALLIFYLLVRPVICHLGGRQEPALPIVKARVKTKLFSARGRRTFVMVSVHRDENELLWALPVSEQSGAITTLGRADGFVEIPEAQQFVDVGEEVNVHLLRLSSDKMHAMF